MRPRSPVPSLVFAGALVALVGVAAFAGCDNGGNGISNAPPYPEACPATAPAAGASCKGPQVCSYGDVVAVCGSGTASTWRIEQRGDGGGFTESGTDTGTDAADAADGADGADAADGADGADAADGATDAADAGDATDAAADAPTDAPADAVDDGAADASDAAEAAADATDASGD